MPYEYIFDKWDTHNDFWNGNPEPAMIDGPNFQVAFSPDARPDSPRRNLARSTNHPGASSLPVRKQNDLYLSQIFKGDLNSRCS